MAKINFYLKISFQIILIFFTAILISFIPDNAHSFFNDTFCLGNIGSNKCVTGWQNSHGTDWHWGYRHYLWGFMGIVLFIIQVIRIISICDKEIDKAQLNK